MFSTSDEYKERIYTSNNDCLLNIYIEDNLVADDDIFDFKITHNLFESSTVTLGTTTSKTIEIIKTISEDIAEMDIELFEDFTWGDEYVCNEVDFNDEDSSYYVSDTDISSAYLDCLLDAELYDNEVDGTSIDLDANNLYIINEKQIANIYAVVKNLEFYSFEGQSWVDPALDIGDIVYIDDKPVVFQGDMEYLGKFKGNISSKIEVEQKKNTTVGSTLSYSTKMRKITETVEELNEDVSNRVDKNAVIQAINEST